MKNSTINLLVKKLHPEAIIPSYQYPRDAGLDLAIVESVTLQPQERRLVGTGLAIQIPEGYEGQLRARSGSAFKLGLTLINGVGTVENTYRGEIKLALINLSPNPISLEAGSRVAQLIINKIPTVKVIEVSELQETTRGDNGFGSTGIR
jgi:dUTP pyrophosphatase